MQVQQVAPNVAKAAALVIAQPTDEIAYVSRVSHSLTG
jgi:hypothetical protein